MSDACYCISIRKAARKVTALYDAALAPVGVNLAQFSLLRTVERRAPVSLTELGRHTDLDRSTVGRNVKVLERMGLVAMVGGEDQREAMVELAAKGSRVLADGAPLWDATQRSIETTLGRDAARHLQTLLQSL
jgi:DNA-binding MarR family transcriptional regulator